MVIVGGCGVFVRERKWEQLKTSRSYGISMNDGAWLWNNWGVMRKSKSKVRTSGTQSPFLLTMAQP